MAGDYVTVAINEGRDGEPKGLDRAGDLLDLLPAVMARIARIGP